MAMKLGRVGRVLASASCSRLGRTMPSAEEKASWSVSTAMMSFHLVIDQNRP